MKKQEKKSVIIVESDSLTRITLKAIVNKTDGLFVKETFDNAEDCLLYVKKNSVDIVILDAWLPRVSGIEISSIIKSFYPSVKILIITPEISIKHSVSILFAQAEAYYIRDLGCDYLTSILMQLSDNKYLIDLRIKLALVTYIKTLPQSDYNEFINSLTNLQQQILVKISNGETFLEISSELALDCKTIYDEFEIILTRLNSVFNLCNFLAECKYELF